MLQSGTSAKNPKKRTAARDSHQRCSDLVMIADCYVEIKTPLNESPNTRDTLKQAIIPGGRVVAISPKLRTLLDMKSRHNMVLRDELQFHLKNDSNSNNHSGSIKLAKTKCRCKSTSNR